MTRQMRWVSLVSLAAALAVGAVGCLGDDQSSDGTSVSIGALSIRDCVRSSGQRSHHSVPRSATSGKSH